MGRPSCSPHVRKNLNLIRALCDPLTEAKVVNDVIKNASQPLAQAVLELLHNIDADAVRRTKQKIIGKRSLKERRRLLKTNWKTIRSYLLKLVTDLCGDEEADAAPRVPRGDASQEDEIK